jgi:putative ABC transport system permease protein
VNLLVLLLDETRSTGAVVNTLKEGLERRGLELRTWDWLNDFYWKAVALYDRQFGVLRLIVLAMVILAVVGAVNMAVLERAGEFGTMRALGNTAWDVTRLVVAEGVLMGVLGALCGVALGCGAAWLVSAIGIPMPPPPNSNLEFTARIPLVPSVVLIAFLVGLVATIVASLIPALRVSRLPVVEALRHYI